MIQLDDDTAIAIIRTIVIVGVLTCICLFVTRIV